MPRAKALCEQLAGVDRIRERYWTWRAAGCKVTGGGGKGAVGMGSDGKAADGAPPAGGGAGAVGGDAVAVS